MKKDVHHHEAIYKNWKERVLEEGDEELNKENTSLLLEYVFDMEIGRNVGKGSKKGARSFGRLNVIRQKVKRIFLILEERGVKDIRKLNDADLLHNIFEDMEKGVIKNKSNGKKITFVADYVSNFKSFWHWWMKVNRLKGKRIEDLTEDLSLKAPPVRFVYLTKENVEEMIPYFNKQQQILIMFLFDSIIRVPTECFSLTGKDVYLKNGEVWINIPEGVSKTFGRTFNLLFSGDELNKYIRENNIGEDDHIFTLNYKRFNEKLKKVAKQLWGDRVSHPTALECYSALTCYDFRHSGAIYLRQMSHRNSNISLDAIRQRGGWSDFKMLNYYTKFLGLTGEIKKEALLIEQDKTQMEKEIEKQRKQLKIMKKEMGSVISFLKGMNELEEKQQERLNDLFFSAK